MSEFLETVQAQFNRMRARHFAGEGYEGVTHAGIALVDANTGLVLMAQRSMDETDAPDVQETWEFPGGHLNPGEEPLEGAMREFEEELGFPLPEDYTVVNGWRANDIYQGFVCVTNIGLDLSDWVPTKEVQAVAWVPPRANRDMKLRPELADFDWTLLDVSGNEEAPMTEDTTSEEPMLSLSDLTLASVPIHGVLAPEEAPTGDSRGFNAGSITARPYRLPFRWQKSDIGGHDGAIVVGSVDRLMRKDGMIHWEGSLMPSADAGEFAEMLAFFGRFGVSVDGDKGSLDAERTDATGVVWFDAVRASGLTAVAIPAFAEAYVAFGPHPDMPHDAEDSDVLTASGDLITFDRGPGWITNPVETKRIHDYWTKKGEPGYAKIGWGTPGDFTRAKKLIGEKIGANSPEDLRFLNQIIAQWHYDALGYWPGDLDKPGNKTSAEAKAEREAKASLDFREVDTEERKRLAESGAAMPDGSFPIANCEDLRNAIQAIGRAKDPAAVKSHIRKRKSALGCDEVDLPETWASEGEWEVVLTSSAGVRAVPPLSYFEQHEDTGALVIDEPDASGLRRVYGFAAEDGVCHIGYEGRCVTAPTDPAGEYREFHLGRTKTDEGYIFTGLLTYNVEHRNAQQILSEGPTQAHFDNLKNAWAAVRIGNDEENGGIWFSGVVLPDVDEDHLVKIEASGQVSGEWKYGALRALLTVNVPGFPVMRSSAAYDEDGNLLALAASAIGLNGCEPTPAERMQALAAADAEVRMGHLREQFNWTDVAEILHGEAIEDGRVEPVGLRDDGAIVYELDGEVPGTDTIVQPYPAEV